MKCSLASSTRRLFDRMWDFLLRPFTPSIHRIVYRTPYVHSGRRERVILGEGVNLENVVLNAASGTITIGDRTIFGTGCMVLTGRHEFTGSTRKSILGQREVPSEGYDVSIGSGCWIASGAIICGGVSIGDGVIVAAGAVVTKDVPDGVLVGGVPARVLRTLTIG